MLELNSIGKTRLNCDISLFDFYETFLVEFNMIECKLSSLCFQTNRVCFEIYSVEFYSVPLDLEVVGFHFHTVVHYVAVFRAGDNERLQDYWVYNLEVNLAGFARESIVEDEVFHCIFCGVQ